MKTGITVALALTPALALAGESANYSITPLTIDAGGGRSMSANFTLDSSAAPGGAADSPNLTARIGYAGALFDLLALDLTASPLTVDEGGTRQLAASLVLDDSSLLALAPGSVAWSVQNGPLTGISTGGIAAAGIVYQTANALARGNYQSFTNTLTLSVLNVNDDNFGTYAADGVADDWQVLHFGTNNPNAAPLLDPDNDSWTNLFEYNAGLDPTDAASIFNFRQEPVPGQPNQQRIIFSPRLPGRTYAVVANSTLAPGSWVPLNGASVSDNGSERTVTDPDATGDRKFYRIQVERP